MQGSGGEESIDHGERGFSSRSAAGDPAPAIGDGLVYGQNAAGEAQRQVAAEPGFQGSSASGIRQGSNAFTNLAQSQNAKMEKTLINGLNPRSYPALRAALNQLRNDIRIEQKPAHKSTFRP